MTAEMVRAVTNAECVALLFPTMISPAQRVRTGSRASLSMGHTVGLNA